MTPDRLRKLLLSFAGATEEHPFGPDPHVYKVGGRMFALVSPERPLRSSLKLEPLQGHLLRAQNPSVLPGYHLNKDHWNTVTVGPGVPDEELADWIEESYWLVVANLPRKTRDALGASMAEAREGVRASRRPARD